MERSLFLRHESYIADSFQSIYLMVGNLSSGLRGYARGDCLNLRSAYPFSLRNRIDLRMRA